MMKGLIAWLIIVCLAFTNAAPPDKDSQNHSAGKNLKLSNSVKRSIKYVQTIPEAINTYNTYVCDLNLTLGDNRVSNEFLRTFDHSRILLSLQVENYSKLFSVDMKNCSAKELTLDVFNEIDEIAFRDDRYYVLFRDDEICKKLYCIAIYDSDGNIIEAAAPLVDIYASFTLRMKVNNKGLLINGFGSNAHVKLYFVPFDDLNGAKLLLFSPYGRWFGFSTAENKLGYCAIEGNKTVRRKILCEQYDAEGKKKIMSTEIQFDEDDFAEHIKVENLDKGMMLKMVEWQHQGPYDVTKHNRVIYIDEQGKQGKRNDIDLKCEDDEFSSNQMYKNSIGEYCITYFCTIDYNKLLVPYSNCFKKSELV